MKFQAISFTALSLATLMAVAAGCSPSNKMPTGPSRGGDSQGEASNQQAPPVLGAAGVYAVLAGATVTNTGATVVTGDLGVSPGTAVTGFPPGQLVGTLHAGDVVAAQAKLDLGIAYGDLAGRTVGAVLLAGNLGGLTLSPGLYKSISSLEISSGDLTLDALGDSNAVFIFQMASTLTTTTARQVFLSGGAKAANVYWLVGSSATLGTGSILKGNILALASITVNTGAVVEGRLLAQTGAVTLNASTVGGASAQVPADITAPVVGSKLPLAGTTGVLINSQISVTFSELMAPTSINPLSFTLKQGTTLVSGSVSYAGKTASFTPAANLNPLTVYTASITTGVKDLAGNPLAAASDWSFTTAGSPTGLAPITLGSAGSLAILAGSTITNTGATTITGNVALSPGTAVTGFPPGIINGSLNVGNTIAAQAQLDLTIAFNDAAGRVSAPIGVAGNLGGLTLAPGLYKSSTSLAISSGDLTLDAQGDPNAVFIFQMGTTLTTTSGRAVILAGGAKASNIFWQVGSSATLGTTSVFKGTIMADQSISLATGATLNGRALARIGAVTLDGNAVVLAPVVVLGVAIERHLPRKM